MAQPQPPAPAGGGFNWNNLSTGQKILPIAAFVLLISLFLPWASNVGGFVGEIEEAAEEFAETFGGEDVDTSTSVSGLAATFVNYLTLLFALAVITWEALLVFGVKINTGTMSPALISAAAGAATALFAIIAFLMVLGRISWGAFFGLVAALAVAYGAFVRFQESKVGTAR